MRGNRGAQVRRVLRTIAVEKRPEGLIRRTGTIVTDTHQDQLLQVHRRLDVHDSRIVKLETQAAVAAERAENIRQSLQKIEANIGWLIKLVVGGIVTGVVAFLLSGGFHVG
ncbi:MAG: hypothetical protein DI498_10910 [Paracoccus denitrificans]|nr:MAG: hypothetical protein DI498_10910 [Paracoccus denitrificans]PZO83651.1 MAG: hypothetical protein DI633_10910 [Paracoccus denitrificans]